MTIVDVVAWIDATAVSGYVKTAKWVIPTVQTFHILAICIVVGAALMLGLRMAGVLGANEALIGYARRYLPWQLAALAVLLLTGLILVAGEPNRTLVNWVFWTKMALVAVGVLLTAALAMPLARDERYWELAGRRGLATTLGLSLLLVWTGIIFCGRWIAYVLF